MTLPTERARDRSVLEPVPGRRPPLVLMYHRIADVDHDPHRLAVGPARFAQQMAWLKRWRLRGVSMGELINAVRSGRNHRLVGITFDDGYADLADHVPAVLNRYGFTATVFVVSGRLGGTNDWDEATPWPLLDADGVRRLAVAGLEIGSHGRRHVALVGASSVVLAEETDGSRRDLETILGSPVCGFAYPYGSMDGAARAAVEEAGYAYGCAVFARADHGLLAMPRIFVGEQDGPFRLAAKRLLFRRHVRSSS
jgi:peptidoglycan/xylan/chitin deacetylase (PgdA/CDA1 family)